MLQYESSSGIGHRRPARTETGDTHTHGKREEQRGEAKARINIIIRDRLT